MKKLIAMLLCLTMLLGSLAMAENFNENVLTTYAIHMDDLPANYNMESFETEYGMYVVFSTANETDCMYFVSVAPDETFAGMTLSQDMDQDTLSDLIGLLTAEYNNPEVTWTETSHGTPVIVIDELDCDNDYADLFTIWNGYCIGVTMLKDDALTEADFATALELLSDLWVTEIQQPAAPMMAGGWNLNAELNNDVLDAFYKAAGDDTDLQPMDLLGTQVVAGTNYAVLCMSPTGWKIAYVYAALDGTATMERVQTLLPMDENSVGGWVLMTPESDDYDTAYEKVNAALSGMMGASYTDCTVLASQLVAGTNYAVIARKTLVTAEPTTNWALLTIYVDLEGNASVTNVEDITLSLAE